MEAVRDLALSLVEKFPVVGAILAGIGLLLIVAQGVVLLTPTKKDDAIVDGIKKNVLGGAILSFLLSFAPVQKDAEGKLVSSSTAAKK